MSDKTGIEWTRGDDGTPGATWNPVTGCTKISAGCDRCYAHTFAERWRGVPGHYFEHGFDVQLRPDKLEQPLKWAKPRRIFVNSMADLFHKDVPDEYIARVFAVMAMASQHTFLILTKRHARMRSFLQDDCRCGEGHAPGVHLRSKMDWAGTPHSPTYVPGVVGSEVYHERLWPLPNVHLGVSVEDQHWADIRIPALLDTPAAVRFISAEPLIGQIDIRKWLQRADNEGTPSAVTDRTRRVAGRPGGPDLEGREAGRHGTGARISAPAVHGGQQAIQHRGTPDRLDDCQRQVHPGGDGGQPQGRESRQQSPVEPGDRAEGLQRRPWPASVGGNVSPADIRSKAFTRSGTGNPGTVSPQGAPEGRDSAKVWHHGEGGAEHRDAGELAGDRSRINWLIAGGESGPGARSCELAWLRQLRNQCTESGTAFFMKQLGSVLGRKLGAGPKGGDMGAWPEDLRVREFPRTAETAEAH